MRTLICDDHRLFSDALASLLADQGFHVVGCPTDTARAIARIASQDIELCLMDVSFGQDPAGIAAIRSVRSTSPNTRIVVLTGTTDPALVLQAIDAGADDIAFKGDDIDDVVATIRGAATSDALVATAPSTPTPPEPLRSLRDADDLGRFLTDREYEVLGLLVDGRSTKQIARHLDIANSTARTHVQNILVKLGVHSRLEAVATSLARGLTNPGRFGPVPDRR